MKELEQLPGLGPVTCNRLRTIGIATSEQFLVMNPYDVYALMKNRYPDTSLNAMYAIIGAQQNCRWQDVKVNHKTEILLQLDDMGLAP